MNKELIIVQTFDELGFLTGYEIKGEVVRCKDCKHFVRSEGVCKLLSNNYEPPVYVDDDDFCSRGERRSE
jgi:hypothetical protein